MCWYHASNAMQKEFCKINEFTTKRVNDKDIKVYERDFSTLWNEATPHIDLYRLIPPHRLWVNLGHSGTLWVTTGQYKALLCFVSKCGKYLNY